MQVYQIFVPELNAYVKFKVLSPEDVSNFLADLGPLEEDDFCKAVLEHLVYNIKTEIRESLKMMSLDAAKMTIEALYNGCVMLNPGLDSDQWVSMAYSKVLEKPIAGTGLMVSESPAMLPEAKSAKSVGKRKKLSTAKFANLYNVLSDRVVGQEEAISILCSALKRSQAGLADEKRPLGVFLFAGASGIGKSSLAKELHSYLYGDDVQIVRIDCGEYQHKHENQKLTGSPPGYVGHEDGGQLTNAVLKNPNTVILIDEIEKAHPDIFNTFLRIFDEGKATDSHGRVADFRNAIIIMTTNLGNDKVVDALTGKGAGFNARIQRNLVTKELPPRSAVERATHEELRRMFKPEFLNRIDSTIVFNHLKDEDYTAIADLEFRLIDEKLSKKGISFSWNESAIDALIDQGVDTVMGARGMAQVRRDKIETILADAILAMSSTRGAVFSLTFDTEFTIDVRNPKSGSAKTS